MVPRPAELSLKQPDVLDCDHGLVGEGLEQPDLIFRERVDIHAPYQNCAEGGALPQERRRQRRPMAMLPLHFQSGWILALRLGREIGHVDGTRVDHGASRHPVPGDDPFPETNRDRAERGRQPQDVSLGPEDLRVDCTARRAALSATACSTGVMSVGELAITRRISPVATCCSSALPSSSVRACTSSNSRAFSIAMTA
jgi:hypothetical protein